MSGIIPRQTKTPQGIVYIVILTASLIGSLCAGTLCFIYIFRVCYGIDLASGMDLNPIREMAQYALTFLFGSLVNTRSAEVPSNDKAVDTQTTTVTSTETREPIRESVTPEQPGK